MNVACLRERLEADRRRPRWGDMVAALVRRRIERGATIQGLSESIGCSENTLAKWETCRRFPTAYSLHCWLEALDLALMLPGEDPPDDSRALRGENRAA